MKFTNRIIRISAQLSVFALGISLLLGGCKEINSVNLGNTAIDTSYVAAAEIPQQRNIVMEEFTGVTCPHCPAGHKVLASIVDAYMNTTTGESRVKAIGIQIFGFKQCEPMENGLTQHDNRTQAGTELTNGIFGSLGLAPSAGIDRIVNGGTMFQDRALWTSLAAARLALPSAVNMTVTSSYNATNKVATIKIHAAYTKDISKKQLLTIAIIENGIIDGQEEDFHKDTLYHHEHVLRDIITSHTGSPIMNDIATKEAGRVYERTIVYNMSGAEKALWVPQNCHVIAYISNAEGADKEIQQAAEAKLQ